MNYSIQRSFSGCSLSPDLLVYFLSVVYCAVIKFWGEHASCGKNPCKSCSALNSSACKKCTACGFVFDKHGRPTDTKSSDGYAVSSSRPTNTKASDGYLVGTSGGRPTNTKALDGSSVGRSGGRKSKANCF